MIELDKQEEQLEEQLEEKSDEELKRLILNISAVGSYIAPMHEPIEEDDNLFHEPSAEEKIKIMDKFNDEIELSLATIRGTLLQSVAASINLTFINKSVDAKENREFFISTLSDAVFSEDEKYKEKMIDLMRLYFDSTGELDYTTPANMKSIMKEIVNFLREHTMLLKKIEKLHACKVEVPTVKVRVPTVAYLQPRINRHRKSSVLPSAKRRGSVKISRVTIRADHEVFRSNLVRPDVFMELDKSTILNTSGLPTPLSYLKWKRNFMNNGILIEVKKGLSLKNLRKFASYSRCKREYREPDALIKRKKNAGEKIKNSSIIEKEY